MSYVTNTAGTSPANFLDSEVGLVLKTVTVPESLGVADGTKKIAKAGTPFPANDNTAKGILFHDVDVTNGDAAGSLLVAGRVLESRITIASTAKTALKEITFVAANEVTR